MRNAPVMVLTKAAGSADDGHAITVLPSATWAGHMDPNSGVLMG